MSYIKVRPGHVSYERVQACKLAGLFVCDAVSHNSNAGCSNPECFKYQAEEYRDQLEEVALALDAKCTRQAILIAELEQELRKTLP